MAVPRLGCVRVRKASQDPWQAGLVALHFTSAAGISLQSRTGIFLAGLPHKLQPVAFFPN